MAVEVAEEVVDVLGGDRVAVPLLDIEGQQGLVRMGFGLLDEALKMLGQVLCEFFVEILPQKMSCECVRQWRDQPLAGGRYGRPTTPMSSRA